MKTKFLILLLIFAPPCWSYGLPSHWPSPLSTLHIEAYKQQRDILSELEDRLKAKAEYLFYDIDTQLYKIGQQNSAAFSKSDFIWELSVKGVIEVIGLIEKYRNENFDFSRPVSINFKGPLLKSEDGRRYRPNSPDEIEDPKARADYIEKTKKIKAYAKRYNYQYALKRGWESWMGLFHLSIYGQIANQGDNAVDREKVKVVYELVRTANITEQSKQKLRFWLTMMVECDKSLVKKAREENDQTCANYVKELHGDSSVGDSSIGDSSGGNAQRHKRS